MPRTHFKTPSAKPLRSFLPWVSQILLLLVTYLAYRNTFKPWNQTGLLLGLMVTFILLGAVVEISELKRRKQAFSFCWWVSLALFATWVHSDLISVYRPPDSYDYLNNLVTRTKIYPLFLMLVRPFSDFWTQDQAYYPQFYGVVVVQRLLAFAAFLFFTRRLYRIAPVGPLLFVGILYLFEKCLWFSYSLISINQYIGGILSEAIIYTWLLVVFGVLLKTPEKPSWRWLVSWGALIYCGIEIAPRLLPFGLFAFLPFFKGAIASRILLLSPSKWWKATPARLLVPVLVFGGLVMIRSTYVYLRFGSFAPAPYAGIVLTGVGLQFSEAQDAELLEDEKLREIFRRAHADPRKDATIRDTRFINLNIGIVGTLYSEFFPGFDEDYAFKNQIFGKISEVALKPWKNKKKWWLWVAEITWNYFMNRKAVTFLSIGLFAFAVWSIRRRPDPFSALALIAALSHAANILLCNATNGIDARYLETGELVVVTTFAVLLSKSLRKKFGRTSRMGLYPGPIASHR